MYFSALHRDKEDKRVARLLIGALPMLCRRLVYTIARVVFQNVADAFLGVDFVWEDKWMRWYVNDVLLLEEIIREVDGSKKDVNVEDPRLVVDMSVTGSGAAVAVERIALSTGNSSDPLCAPSHSNASNCRVQKCTWIASLSGV